MLGLVKWSVFAAVVLLASSATTADGLRVTLSPSAPSRKAWWAKQVSEELYTAGLLTENMYKQAGEAGFRTIISMFNHTQSTRIGDELQPTSARARDVVTRLVGIHFAVVLQPGQSWKRVETVQRFTELMHDAPRPVLFHCYLAHSATFTALAYLANISTAARTGDKSKEFFARAASIGYFFNKAVERRLLASITGDPVVARAAKLDMDFPYFDSTYWFAKPVYKNIYVTGQIRRSHLANLRSPFDTLVNLRKGLTRGPDGAPAQEEVTLLNIRDRTGTYTKGGRQTETRLGETRLDPTKSNDYIVGTADRNYESRNSREFGDDIGYNEQLQKQAVQATNLSYIHTPVGGQYGITEQMFRIYKDTWTKASEGKAVIFHCRTGYRAVVAALLTVGYKYRKDGAWAIQRAKDIGYHFDDSGATTVLKLFREVLDPNAGSSAAALDCRLMMTLPVVSYLLSYAYNLVGE